ncbi:MAG: cryptochrome/photolyase family protein [Polyangiaceae bacterium]
MAKPAYFVGPWDLNQTLACVPDDPAAGSVLLVESRAKSRAVPYHKKKLVLVLSAMHHFAEGLRERGYDVTLVNAASYLDGIAEHVTERQASRVVALRPREWGLDRRFAEAAEALGLELLDDGGPGGHFLLSRAEFADWASGRRLVRMADFYRFMRKRSGYLMQSGKPKGGKWSYDDDNRHHARGVTPPAIERHEPDALTRRIMERVATWKGYFGEVDGFDWPVTREQALADLDRFFEERAEGFGRYQDAMLVGEPYLFHSLVSPALNLSLLSPREICERIALEEDAGRIPLASAEGLLRQILGWREFIRGIYWHRMPALRSANLLDARRPLPDFFWHPERTTMTCLRESLGQVEQLGYGHHIQRLMVQGNFALLAGIDPLAISHWFWAAFVDAYEWVELPNVHGMAVYADDTFTTKPYAASGSYIHKMSDYCRRCPFDVKQRHGEKACPFNYLYWSFMQKHRERLAENPRLGMLYRTWDRFDEAERAAILASAEGFVAGLTPSEGWSFDDDAG